MESPKSALSVTVDHQHRGTIVRLSGELDLTTGRELCAQVAALFGEEVGRLALDLNGLEFLDSAGLRVLLTICRDAHRAGGELRIICVSPRHLRLFRITGLQHVFHVYSSEAEALEWPSASAA